MWSTLPIYNITTSDFGKGEVMWLAFLMAALNVPGRVEDRVQTVPKLESSEQRERFAVPA